MRGGGPRSVLIESVGGVFGAQTLQSPLFRKSGRYWWARPETRVLRRGEGWKPREKPLVLRKRTKRSMWTRRCHPSPENPPPLFKASPTLLGKTGEDETLHPGPTSIPSGETTTRFLISEIRRYRGKRPTPIQPGTLYNPSHTTSGVGPEGGGPGRDLSGPVKTLDKSLQG